MIVLDLSILNQKGTPMFNSDTFANRPSFGIVGRIFISTDTKEFYRDTGTSWELIGGPGSGTITGSGTVGTLPIWTTTSALGNSTLIEGATLISTTKDIKADAFYLTGAAASNGALYWTSDRVTLANYNVGGSVHIEVNGGVGSTTFGTDLSLTNNGYISAVPTLTAANNASSVAIIGVNTLSYAASFSSNNIGAIYGAITGFNLQTFAGSATFANSNVASGGSSVNSIDFSSGGSTITMTQSSGIRVMSGQQNLFQYQGTNSGTITHAAISQNTGFYRPSSATGILTITNAYSLLINALDDYGAGFTFTNRWGIYQAGASDLNYFAANMLVGSTTNNGSKLQITGAATISSSLTAASLIKSGGTSAQYLMADGSTSTLTNPVTGGGTTDYLPKWNGSTSLGNSVIFENGTNIGIGITNADYKLTVSQINVGGAGASLGIILDSIISTAIPSSSVKSIIGVTNSGFGFAAGSLILQPRTGVVASTIFATEGSAKMLLTSTGNFLVGTTTDGGQKMQVSGVVNAYSGSSLPAFIGTNLGIANWINGTSATWYAHIGHNSQYTGFGTVSGSNIESPFTWFYNGNAANGFDVRAVDFGNDPRTAISLFTVRQGGNVGIGNSSPSFLLDVNGTGRYTGALEIGNSVAVAVAAPSTHKISILVGGVQYYLLASNV